MLKSQIEIEKSYLCSLESYHYNSTNTADLLMIGARAKIKEIERQLDLLKN